MLDMKFVRNNPEVVKENIRRKFQDQKLPLVDEVIEFDRKYRAAKTRCDELRNQRNVISKQIGGMMAQGRKEEAEAAKAQVKAMADEMARLEEDEKVRAFVGERNPEHYLLNPEETLAVGPYAVSSYYMETKRGQRQAMIDARRVILEVAERFREMTGREYGFFEAYRMEDEEYAVVLIGSAAGTCKAAIEQIRSTTGKKVGLVKIRVFRPFPEEEIAAALADVKAVAILDRSEMFSATGGPLGAEVRAALYDAKSRAEVVNYFYGLGGRDITVEDFRQIYDRLEEIAQTHIIEDMYAYIGLREK